MPTPDERVEQLEARLRRMEDMEAVRRLLGIYCSALDARDGRTMETLFALDARLAVPTWNLDFQGREAIMRFYEDYFQMEWKDPRHYCANIVIEPEGSGYKSFAYFHETASRGTESVIGWGTLEDVLTYEDNAWKFSSRIITVLALTPITKGWAGPDRVMAL